MTSKSWVFQALVTCAWTIGSPQVAVLSWSPVTLSGLGGRKPQLAVDNFLSPGGSGNWGPVTRERRWGRHGVLPRAVPRAVEPWMGGVHLGSGCREPTKSAWTCAHLVAAACPVGLSAGRLQAVHSQMGTMGVTWALLASVSRPDLRGTGFWA